MFADRVLFEGMAAPVTLVAWRSHRVKRVVASASAAEAMGLSEAIAQGGLGACPVERSGVGVESA